MQGGEWQGNFGLLIVEVHGLPQNKLKSPGLMQIDQPPMWQAEADTEFSLPTATGVGQSISVKSLLLIWITTPHVAVILDIWLLNLLGFSIHKTCRGILKTQGVMT